VRGAARRADERAFFLSPSFSLSLSLSGLSGGTRGKMRVPGKGKVGRGVPRSAAFIYYRERARNYSSSDEKRARERFTCGLRAPARKNRYLPAIPAESE